jgi:CBS domain-containing protein
MRRKISQVMRDRPLVTLPATASVRQAAELMARENIGAVLVTNDSSLEGIFTERDLLARVVARGRDPKSTILREVMTAKPDTIEPNTLALGALHKMHDGGYRHLPVVERGRLVGIVSRRDFIGTEEAQLDQENELWEKM